MGPNIIGHRSQIFADHARAAAFLKHHPQILFAFPSVRCAILQRRIIARREMRNASMGSRQHLVPIEWKKLLVSRRSPRESVNPIKPEDMIDAKKMKCAFCDADALPPPFEIVSAHCLPAIKGNTPVLPPFLRELVVFEIQLRWRAASSRQNFLKSACGSSAAFSEKFRNAFSSSRRFNFLTRRYLTEP